MKEIALHVLDISENSVSAGADRISIRVEKNRKWISIRVKDNGRGMDAETKRMADDPFFTSRNTRKVGMGIPLLKQHAEMTGGKVEIVSESGAGTCIEATFGLGHPDLQPLGDLEGCWILMVSSFPEVEWELECRTVKGAFTITTSQIRSELGIEKVAGSELTGSLKCFLRNQMESIRLD